RLLAGHGSGIARLYETATGKELRRFGNRPKSVRTVAVTPDGRRCLIGFDATLADANAIELYNLESGALIDEYKGHTRALNGLVVSHDGQRILSGGADGTLRLWETRGLPRVLRTFQDPDGKPAVTGVAFLPGDKRAVSTSADGSLRVWDVESGKPVL